MTEQERSWVRQWRKAGVALEEVRRLELAALSEEQAAQAADSLMSGTPRNLPPRMTSGLVEQQRIFRKALAR